LRRTFTFLHIRKNEATETTKCSGRYHPRLQIPVGTRGDVCGCIASVTDQDAV
jgi:hypothetical protein